MSERSEDKQEQVLPNRILAPYRAALIRRMRNAIIFVDDDFHHEIDKALKCLEDWVLQSVRRESRLHSVRLVLDNKLNEAFDKTTSKIVRIALPTALYRKLCEELKELAVVETDHVGSDEYRGIPIEGRDDIAEIQLFTEQGPLR